MSFDTTQGREDAAPEAVDDRPTSPPRREPSGRRSSTEPRRRSSRRESSSRRRSSRDLSGDGSTLGSGTVDGSTLSEDSKRRRSSHHHHHHHRSSRRHSKDGSSSDRRSHERRRTSKGTEPSKRHSTTEVGREEYERRKPSMRREPSRRRSSEDAPPKRRSSEDAPQSSGSRRKSSRHYDRKSSSRLESTGGVLLEDADEKEFPSSLSREKSKGTLRTVTMENSSIETDSERQEKGMVDVAGAQESKNEKPPMSLAKKRCWFYGGIAAVVGAILLVVFFWKQLTGETFQEAAWIFSPPPTASMSPSVAPSISMVPSDFPSMIPSVVPSSTPTDSVMPSALPSLEPSTNPSSVPTLSLNPTWTKFDRDNYRFKLRLYWESSYFWQEEKDERWWCMECVRCAEYGRGDGWEHGCQAYRSGDNGNCRDGDSVWIRDCRNRGNRFNVLQIEQTTSFMLRLDDTNLCLEKVNMHIIVKVCNEGELNQQFVPWYDWSQFELRPLTMEGWSERDADCVSQEHHPKEDEVVGMHNCREQRYYETRYWEIY